MSLSITFQERLDDLINDYVAENPTKSGREITDEVLHDLQMKVTALKEEPIGGHPEQEEDDEETSP